MFEVCFFYLKPYLCYFYLKKVKMSGPYAAKVKGFFEECPPHYARP